MSEHAQEIRPAQTINETGGITSRPDFQASVETRLLYARLRAVEVGHEVSYVDLSNIASADVQGNARAALNSARRMVQRGDKIVFGVVRGVGLKRLSDAETAESATSDLTKMRRVAHRGLARQYVVNPDNLTPEQKSRRVASMAALNVGKAFGKPKSVEKIAAANVSGDELPLARTLELFKGPRSI